MIYLDTTRNISHSTLSSMFSRRIQGKVRIRQQDSMYFFHCQRTPEYYDVLDFIQQYGGFPFLVEGDVIVLKLHLLSKL